MKKMQLRRYHYQIWFPDNTNKMTENFFEQFSDIDITYHAAEQLIEDRHGIIPLPSKSEMMNNENTLIEFYEILNDNKRTNILQKALIRIHNLDPKLDYSYVLAREGYVVSAWSQRKNDVQKLTKSLYEYYCPPDLKEQIYNQFRETKNGI